MLLSFIFLALWAQDSKYEPSARKCVEATYAGSELKPIVEHTEEWARKKVPPVLITVGAPLYAVYVKHEVRLTSSKITPIPGTVATYSGNQNQGSISVTWHF